MENQSKYDQIIDAFRELLENKDIQHISVNQIAEKAGIGKGSIYYYFPSKDAILDALIERVYASTITLANELKTETNLSASERIARIFNSSRKASHEFIIKSEATKKQSNNSGRIYDSAYIHQQFMSHIIKQQKPIFADIINQGIQTGEIKFDYPNELADIILIVLTVKLDNTLSPASEEEITRSLQALISLSEKGTDNPLGAFNLQV